MVVTTLEATPNAAFWQALGEYMRARIVEQVVETVPVVYELTDGQEVTATRLMTPEQAREANQKAANYTDGNWHWQPNPQLS